MAYNRIPCDGGCGREIPKDFLSGPKKGLCRKCRRKKELKNRIKAWKNRKK